MAYIKETSPCRYFSHTQKREIYTYLLNYSVYNSQLEYTFNVYIYTKTQGTIVL